MSILITGMEMPRERKTTLTIFPDGRVYENHGERLWGHGEDCIPWKAVPVPPHGRLIDADAYEALIRGLGDREYRREKGTICDAIKFLHPHYAPTIIPAEEGE